MPHVLCDAIFKYIFFNFWTTNLWNICVIIASCVALWWRHNERDTVWNHQPHDCLLNRLFRRRSRKTRNSRHKGPVTRMTSSWKTRIVTHINKMTSIWSCTRTRHLPFTRLYILLTDTRISLKQWTMVFVRLAKKDLKCLLCIFVIIASFESITAAPWWVPLRLI